MMFRQAHKLSRSAVPVENYFLDSKSLLELADKTEPRP